MNFKHVFLKRTCPLITQIAEAHRKPRWLPVAKSKIYRIPKRPVITEEERLELLRINNNYKTQMRAIRRFYHEEMIKEKSSLESASSEMSQRLEADEWEKCVQLNDKWNLQVRITLTSRCPQRHPPQFFTYLIWFYILQQAYNTEICILSYLIFQKLSLFLFRLLQKEKRGEKLSWQPWKTML